MLPHRIRNAAKLVATGSGMINRSAAALRAVRSGSVPHDSQAARLDLAVLGADLLSRTVLRLLNTLIDLFEIRRRLQAPKLGRSSVDPWLWQAGKVVVSGD